MTAEELKEKVRQYADEHLPGWQCAGVTFRVGPLIDSRNELLLVLPPCQDKKLGRIARRERRRAGKKTKGGA